MYSVLIVDDEKHQQDRLAEMLTENFQEYNIAGIASSVDDGIKKIKALKPHLVFLDVVMPPKTGFDLLEALDERNFETIFTTSYEQYALRAFKVSAVDYLLKPFSLDDLKTALKKFEKRIADTNHANHVDLLLQNMKSAVLNETKIALPTLNGYVFIPVNTIVRCESDDNYTTIFCSDKSNTVISKTLKDCDELLSEFGFFRAHVSHVINLNYVKEYMKGKEGRIKMTDGSIIELSRRKKDEFLKAFRKI